MKTAPARDELLDRLRMHSDALQSAHEELLAAENALRTAPERAAAIVEPLLTYYRDIAFKKREPDGGEERRLSLRVASALSGGSARIVPSHEHGRPGEVTFRLIDPEPARAVEAARDRLARVQAERNEFVEANRKEIDRRLAARRRKLDAARSKAQVAYVEIDFARAELDALATL